MKAGENYRGELFDAEDNWNVQLKNVTATAKVLACTEPHGCQTVTPAACTCKLWPIEICAHTRGSASVMVDRMAGYRTWSTYSFEGAASGAILPQPQHCSCCAAVNARGLVPEALCGCRFIIIPDMLKNAPMFKRIDPKHKASHTAWTFRLCEQSAIRIPSDSRRHSFHTPHADLLALCRTRSFLWAWEAEDERLQHAPAQRRRAGSSIADPDSSAC